MPMPPKKVPRGSDKRAPGGSGHVSLDLGPAGKKEQWQKNKGKGKRWPEEKKPHVEAAKYTKKQLTKVVPYLKKEGKRSPLLMVEAMGETRRE